MKNLFRNSSSHVITLIILGTGLILLPGCSSDSPAEPTKKGPQVVLSPETLYFGQIPEGQTATREFIIFIWWYLTTTKETFDMSKLSSECIKNLSSIYNDNKLTVTNADITGNTTIGGNLNISGNVGGGQSKATPVTIFGSSVAGIDIWHDKMCPPNYYVCGIGINTPVSGTDFQGLRFNCCPFK